MEARELRGLKIEELKAREKTVQEDLQSAQFKYRTGQLEKTTELPRLRREVARIKTILKERLSAGLKKE